MKKYYVGLDIGTNSVGWAVTDEQYNLLKFRRKAMWGIRLFDEANPAADRRLKRTARRRLERRKQRIGLLQELFCEEMAKVDETFFIRLNSSRLHLEDKPEEAQEKHPLFADKDYSDIDYYKEYPTIFHLRKELMENAAPHDIRLVYLAIHHILKNRGHFLIDGDLGSAKSFHEVFLKLTEILWDEIELDIPAGAEKEAENILRKKDTAKSLKAKNLLKLLFVECEDDKEKNKERKTALDQVCKWIVGNKGDIIKFLGNTVEGLEKTSFAFSDTNYDEIRAKLDEGAPEVGAVIDQIKAVYDWNVLVDILDGEEYLSIAKVKQHQKHEENLKRLKGLMKKYCTKAEYKEFFDSRTEKANYANYVGSVQIRGKKFIVKKCKEEDFYKQLDKILNKINADEKDGALLEELKAQSAMKTLLPLQRSKDNGSVPNQVHKAELSLILQNAVQYLPFLAEKDENDISVAEKILSLFTFRVPYYVGPLSKRHAEEGANAWIVRKKEGRILPWNFTEMVDEEKSNEEFIRRMTNKCTYLAGQDVIPKNSLLYSKFMVLNELNNLKIRGREMSPRMKQDIYNNVFCKGGRVTGKKLLEYLRIDDGELTIQDLSGFDIDFKSTLTSYVDFERKVFGERMSEDSIKGMTEDIICWKTIYGDDNKMLDKVIDSKYPGALTKEQLQAIHRLRYSGWGNFSEKLLTGIEGVDTETGETFNLIDALWNTNCNLMQLLSKRFTFREEIDKFNREHSQQVTEISYDKLVGDLRVSPANKRGIWQSLQIVEEIKKVMGCEADKIFVEMARGEEKEKTRKDSRKKRLLDLYASCKEDMHEWIKEIEETDERAFSSNKLYLYYTQMGRCMYTGERIDLYELMTANSKWDKDHIYPQSLIKDDSLDNLVLVKKTYNAKKSNELLSSDIQRQQKDNWKILLDRGFISRKKYDRLMRKDDFSVDELAGFINRQLVETAQASKAAAELLDRVYENTRIVQVKAGVVSQFRQKDLKMLKSRRINDYHHAKDAYLNIVAGNVYDAKFTSNPRQWLKGKIKKSSGDEAAARKYSLNRVFDFDVYRGNTCIWKGVELKESGGPKKNEKGEKYGGTIDKIRETMRRNDILYTEYTYCEKGGLFNETLAKKGSGAQIPLKKGLNPEKYGGYTSANTAYFALIEFEEKKGERVKHILEVPIYVANMLEHNPHAYLEYCERIKGLRNVKILRECIKKNSLISVDGYPMRVRGVDPKNVLFKNNLQLRLEEHEDTVRHLEKYLEKNVQFDVDEKRDKLNEDNLVNLYDALTEKLKSVYKKRPSNQWKNLEKGRGQFLQLTLRDKAKAVNQILNMVRCDANTKGDLTLIGGGANVGSISVNKNTVGKSRLVLFNQSVTGLFENRIEL